MKLRILRIIEDIRTSFWFLPSMMSLAAALLFGFTLQLEEVLRLAGFAPPGWLASIDPPGARALMTTIAGSAITVAGVIFSITIVGLSMSSSQFGPRLVRNFMREGGTQVVLGTFIGTFIFTLLTLSNIRETDNEVILPHLSVSTGLVLGIVSFAVLIYFIHHVTSFIQAPGILSDVAGDLRAVFLRVFPERGEASEEVAEPDIALGSSFAESSKAVLSTCNGYIQVIDYPGLVALAAEHNLVIRTLHRPGHYAVENRALALVAPRDGLTDVIVRGVCAKFVIGVERTSTQDPEFAIDQFVEVALRALSPGINDPFTAVSCIDRLGSALALLGQRQLPPVQLRDSGGSVRVVTEPHTYKGIVDAAFNQIRQHSRGNPAVGIRLLEIIAAIAEKKLDKPFADALLAQAQAVYEESQGAGLHARDMADLEERYRDACSRLAL